MRTPYAHYEVTHGPVHGIPAFCSTALHTRIGPIPPLSSRTPRSSNETLADVRARSRTVCDTKNLAQRRLTGNPRGDVCGAAVNVPASRMTSPACTPRCSGRVAFTGGSKRGQATFPNSQGREINRSTTWKPKSRVSPFCGSVRGAPGNRRPDLTGGGVFRSGRHWFGRPGKRPGSRSVGVRRADRGCDRNQRDREHGQNTDKKGRGPAAPSGQPPDFPSSPGRTRTSDQSVNSRRLTLCSA